MQGGIVLISEIVYIFLWFHSFFPFSVPFITYALIIVSVKILNTKELLMCFVCTTKRKTFFFLFLLNCNLFSGVSQTLCVTQLLYHRPVPVWRLYHARRFMVKSIQHKRTTACFLKFLHGFPLCVLKLMTWKPDSTWRFGSHLSISI